MRVRLRRETNEGEVGYHDKVYEINRIDKTFESKIIYDLTHFPIDSQGRSLIARAVDSASGAGNLIDVGESDVNCDENSSTGNDTVGTDEGGGGTPPDSGDTAIDIPQPDDDDSPFPDGPDLDNQPEDELVPEDPIDQPFNGSIGGYNGDAGDTLNFTPGCANPQITWYKVDPVTGEKIIIKGPGIGTTLDVVEALEANAQMIYAEGCCPDPSTPTAYPICVESEELDISDIFDEIEDCPGGGDAGGKAAQQRSLTLEPHILHRSPLLGRLTQSEIGSLFLARHRMTPGLSAARTLLSLCKRQAPTDTLRSKFKLRPRARLGTIKSDALVDHG